MKVVFGVTSRNYKRVFESKPTTFTVPIGMWGRSSSRMYTGGGGTRSIRALKCDHLEFNTDSSWQRVRRCNNGDVLRMRSGGGSGPSPLHSEWTGVESRAGMEVAGGRALNSSRVRQAAAL